MEIKIMPVGLIGTNCYIISNGKDALIIDPGGDPEKIISYLEEQELKPQAILLTHAHFDHIGGLEVIRNTFQIDVYIHEAEQEWLSDPNLNGSYKLMGNEIVAKPAEHLLKEEEMTLGVFSFHVIHTPGHSPGSVSFIFKEIQTIFSGDVLFNQGIGRTDLPGGDLARLEYSIKEKLYNFEDKYFVYPGHGPKTTIGYEKQNNPFFPGSK